MTEVAITKGLSVKRSPGLKAEQSKKNVRHFTTAQLLKSTFSIPADSTLSMTKIDGRLKVRVESPRGKTVSELKSLNGRT
jgi:hypothetical protein